MNHKSHNNGEKLHNKFGNAKKALQSIPLAAALICGNPSVNTPIALGTAAAVTTILTSCDPNDGPLGPKEIDKNDAPKLESSEKNVEAEKGATLSFDRLNLNLGNHIIARFSDDYSKVLSVSSFTIGGKSVTLPYTFSEAGTFSWSLTVKDSGNGTATAKTTTTSGTITVKEVTPPNENQAPIITPEKYSDGATIKVGGGFRFFHEGTSISIESQGKTEKCFSYSDRETHTENLKPTFTIDGQPIEFGTWYTKGNTVKVEIQDDGTVDNQDEKTQVKQDTITYTLNNEILDNDVLSGLDKLNSLQLKVGTPVDLLNGVKSINGWTISKVEIQQNGQRIEISSPNNYTPTQEGNVFFIVTCTTEAGVNYEVKSNQTEVKENILEYNAVQIPEADTDMYARWNKKLNILSGNIVKERNIFFENMGLLETTEVINLLDQLHGPERAEAFKNVEVYIIGEQPVDGDPSTDGLRTSNYNGTDGGSEHASTRLQYFKKNSGFFPGMAQSFPNKIKCIYSGTGWQDAYNLAKNNPNIHYTFTCAVSSACGKTRDDIKDLPDIKSISDLGKLPNATERIAINDNRKGQNSTSEQDKPPKENGIYTEGSVKGPHIFPVGGCSHAGKFESIDGDGTSTSVRAGDKTLMVGPEYPRYRNRYQIYEVTRAQSSSYSSICPQVFTGTTMIDPTLTADEITSLVDECKEPVPAYHNGEKIDMNAATFNMLKSTKKLTVPQLPTTLSGNTVTVLPQSRVGATIFVSGKGTQGLLNGEYVATDTEHFNNSNDRVNAAKNAFQFDPELFKSQGGKDGDEITVTVVNLEGKHYTRLTDVYKVYYRNGNYVLELQK